jgi:uncharacterized protein
MEHVIVPGIGGSDEAHWQSLWQAEWGPSASRISPASWSEPDLDDWCSAIDRAVGDPAGTVLVAHSLGCLAVASWVHDGGSGVLGVLLVAPPDSAGPNFPDQAVTFTGVGAEPLGVPGLVVSSDDDPYCTRDVTARLAERWGVGHVSAGSVGHVNSASGLGRWEFGRALLTAFVAGAGHRRSRAA